MAARFRLPKKGMQAALVAMFLRLLAVLTHVTVPRKCPQRVLPRTLERHRRQGEMNSQKYTISFARIEFASQLGLTLMQPVGALLVERAMPWAVLELVSCGIVASLVFAEGAPRQPPLTSQPARLHGTLRASPSDQM